MRASTTPGTGRRPRRGRRPAHPDRQVAVLPERRPHHEPQSHRGRDPGHRLVDRPEGRPGDLGDADNDGGYRSDQERRQRAHERDGDRDRRQGEPRDRVDARHPLELSVDLDGISVDRHRDHPLEDLRHRRAFYYRWWVGRHPVDPMIVPAVGAIGPHRQPGRVGVHRSLRWHGASTEAVLVDPVAGGIPVHLDGAVGSDPDIWLAFVAWHLHGHSWSRLDAEEGIATDHVGGHTSIRRLDRGHLRPVVRRAGRVGRRRQRRAESGGGQRHRRQVCHREPRTRATAPTTVPTSPKLNAVMLHASGPPDEPSAPPTSTVDAGVSASGGPVHSTTSPSS